MVEKIRCEYGVLDRCPEYDSPKAKRMKVSGRDMIIIPTELCIECMKKHGYLKTAEQFEQMVEYKKKLKKMKESE